MRMESQGKSPNGGRGAQSGPKEHWGNKNGKGHRTQDEKGILPAQNMEAGKTKSASQQCHGGQRLGFELAWESGAPRATQQRAPSLPSCKHGFFLMFLIQRA